jgi:mRNA interferase RelE/StbE
MAWRIEFERAAEREFRAPDVQTALSFLRDRVASAPNPRIVGQPLKGRYQGLWKYRIGDYRVIARIEGAAGLIVVARVGNRRDVYRR